MILLTKWFKVKGLKWIIMLKTLDTLTTLTANFECNMFLIANPYVSFITCLFSFNHAYLTGYRFINV